MYVWPGDKSLNIDSLLLAWEFREEFNNLQRGMLFVIAEVCQGFSALLVNESKIDALMHESETTICMAASNMLFFAYQSREQHPSSYML